MATAFFRSDGRALWPNSKAAQIALDGMPSNVPLKVSATQPRNIKQHRLFWAFCTLTADAMNDGPAGALMQWAPEDVVERLKIATGHVELCALPAQDAKRLGVTHVARPKSISFAKMDGDAFGKFMDASFVYTRDVLCQWIDASPHWADIQTILRESHLIGSQQ